MIKMTFYRDGEYVYINNPDGTTKRMTIADFESMLNGYDEYLRVDPTLTQSGQAADAKVTGDEISDLKEDLSGTGSYIYLKGWEQGGLDGNGGEVSSPNRVRTIDYIPVHSGDTIIVNPNGQYYIYQIYNSSKEIQQASSWALTYSQVTVPADGYVRFIVASDPISEPITPDDVVLYFTIGNTVENAISKQKYGQYLYTGEKITFGLHGYNSNVAFNLPSTIDIQGVAKSENRFYAWNVSGTNGSVSIIDKNGTIIGNIDTTLPSNGVHGNSLQFCDHVAEGYSLPFLLVGQYYFNGGIYVLGITETNGAYSVAQKQILIFDDLDKSVVGYGYIDFVVDWENKWLYLVRYALANTYDAEEGNYTIITKLKMPELSDTNYRFSSADILDTYTIKTPIYARQQVNLHDGKIFFTSGASTAGGKQMLWVVDFEQKTVATTVNIGAAVEYNEPEATIIDSDSILVFSNHTANVYSLMF